MNEPFWMVWCFVRQPPSKRHTTEQSAIDEAQRLAEKERKAFYVLKCIGEAVPPKPPPVFWVKYAEPTPAKDPLWNSTGTYKEPSLRCGCGFIGEPDSKHLVTHQDVWPELTCPQCKRVIQETPPCKDNAFIGGREDCGTDREYSNGYKQGHYERLNQTKGITPLEKLDAADPNWRDGYMEGWHKSGLGKDNDERLVTF